MNPADIPRRNRLDKMTKAEIAIANAVDRIEEMGADERLTKAQNLLHDARDLVADVVDCVAALRTDKTLPRNLWND